MCGDNQCMWKGCRVFIEGVLICALPRSGMAGYLCVCVCVHVCACVRVCVCVCVCDSGVGAGVAH